MQIVVRKATWFITYQFSLAYPYAKLRVRTRRAYCICIYICSAASTNGRPCLAKSKHMTGSTHSMVDPLDHFPNYSKLAATPTICCVDNHNSNPNTYTSDS